MPVSTVGIFLGFSILSKTSIGRDTERNDYLISVPTESLEHWTREKRQEKKYILALRYLSVMKARARGTHSISFLFS